ncbi:MAG: hypothetical protein PWP44_332 [Thermacetogenium sp.]|nr:hypothetical protein [Thermacetogenium sp.]
MESQTFSAVSRACVNIRTPAPGFFPASADPNHEINDAQDNERSEMR